MLGFVGLVPSWRAGLRLLSRFLVALMVSNSASQADRAALAAAVADRSSSVDRREGFLSRARRVAIWRLRSGKGVRSGGDAVVGSEVDASAVPREVVGVGKDVVTSDCEEVVARRSAEASAPGVDDAGLVVVISILAPVFSPDIVALLERLLY